MKNQKYVDIDYFFKIAKQIENKQKPSKKRLSSGAILNQLYSCIIRHSPNNFLINSEKLKEIKERLIKKGGGYEK